ncbi:MAG: PilZ domain-containing protein, partial [Planctomycetota bacterium]
NISLQGLCCLSSICPEREEILDFYLKIASQDISIKAKVKWCQEESPQRYKIGLEFEFLNEDQQKHIQNFLKDALNKNPLQFHPETDSVRKAIPVRYGSQSEYEGILLSIHPQEIHFRGPLPTHLVLDQPFSIEVVLLEQSLKTTAILHRFQKEVPWSFFVAEFQSLLESERNLIRQFLVDHYLNFD